MSKKWNQTRLLDKTELSAAGKQRRDQMLSDLQASMAQHHIRRQHQKRALKFTSLLLVLIASSSWMLWQSVKTNDLEKDTTAEIKSIDVVPEIEESKPKGGEDQNSRSLNQPYPLKSQHDPKKTLVEKYVVSTANIETRQMESINDDEMLELLKKAGVQGWIAEIGDERVVLDDEGKRL